MGSTDEFLKNLQGISSARTVENQQVEKLSSQLLSKDRWTSEDCAAASAAVASSSFRKESKDKLLEGIAHKLSTCDDGDRGKLQDYTNIVCMLPDSVWESIGNCQTMEQRLDVVMEFACKLGLRAPSEPTFGCMTCVCCWNEWCSSLPTLSKRASEHEKWKPHLRRSLQLAQQNLAGSIPGRHLEKLPNTMEMLPAEMQQVFGTENLGRNFDSSLFFVGFFVFSFKATYMFLDYIRRPMQCSAEFISVATTMPLRKSHSARRSADNGTLVESQMPGFGSQTSQGGGPSGSDVVMQLLHWAQAAQAQKPLDLQLCRPACSSPRAASVLEDSQESHATETLPLVPVQQKVPAFAGKPVGLKMAAQIQGSVEAKQTSDKKTVDVQTQLDRLQFSIKDQDRKRKAAECDEPVEKSPSPKAKGKAKAKGKSMQKAEPKKTAKQQQPKEKKPQEKGEKPKEQGDVAPEKQLAPGNAEKAPAPKKKEKAEKELIMTRKCVTSRAYHRALDKAKRENRTDGKDLAREASRLAGEKWDLEHTS